MPVEISLHRSSPLAGVRFRIALLLLTVPSGCWALPGAMDLTQLSLKELMHVEIASPTSVAVAFAANVAAIRAGCSAGTNVCDALRAVLATANNGTPGDTPRP